jgi:hypothetical protein
MKRLRIRTAALIFIFACTPCWAVNDIQGILRPGTKPGSGIVLGGPVTLTADNLSYEEDTGVAVAEGNVEVGF